MKSGHDMPFDTYRPIGLLIAILAERFEDEFLKRLTATKRFASITVADHRVLRHVAMDASCSIDVARRLGISKQAVGKTVSSLAARGFISIAWSTHDGRAQRLALTKAGRDLISRAAEVARDLDRLSGSAIRPSSLAELCETLEKLELKLANRDCDSAR